MRTRRGESKELTIARKNRKCLPTSIAPSTLSWGAIDQIGESSEVPAYTASSAVRQPIQSGSFFSTRRTNSAASATIESTAAGRSVSRNGIHSAGDRYNCAANSAVAPKATWPALSVCQRRAPSCGSARASGVRVAVCMASNLCIGRSHARPPALGSEQKDQRKGRGRARCVQDVNLADREITIGRSHASDTTKGKKAVVLPAPTPLQPFLEHAVHSAPGEFVFPRAVGTQRPESTAMEKVWHRILVRAGVIVGYRHTCRRCVARKQPATHEFPNAEQRRCPTCNSACGRARSR